MKTTLLLVLTLSGLSVLSAKIVREYHHVRISMTWADALSYCKEKFTNLASVHNKASNDRLVSLVQRRGTYAWIGVYGDFTAWKWVHGNVDAKGFINWKSGEPDVQHPSQNCAMMTENGEWSTSPCHKRHPAVCYDGQGPSKYILVENRTTWSNAIKYCRTNYTDLVRVRNVTENQNISSLLSEDTWIGLHRYRWTRWSDNSHRRFSYWVRGQPNDTGASCALMNTNTGQWHDTKCTEKHYFICQTFQDYKLKVKLKLQSEADLNDPAVQQQILEQLHAKLDEHVVPDFRLRWIETDGQTFHKEQKREEEEGSAEQPLCKRRHGLLKN